MSQHSLDKSLTMTISLGITLNVLKFGRFVIYLFCLNVFFFLFCFFFFCCDFLKQWKGKQCRP